MSWELRIAALSLLASSLTAAFYAQALATERVVRATSGGVELISRAADLAPVGPQALEAARGRLNSSVEDLEKFLAGGGEQKEQAWRQWLDLASLKDVLAKTAPDSAALSPHLLRYTQDQPGLEHPVFAAVRRELRNYLAVTEIATADDPQEVYRDRVAELAHLLVRLNATPTAEEARRAGRLVAWLDAFGPQAADLASAVRAQHCRSNALVQGSARLLNVLLERSVADQRFIADEILGSYTQGMAFTQAHVSLGFAPSHEHATLELRLRGQTTCPANVAQRRGVSVYSSANTAINAGKHVYLDQEGLRLAPAFAACETSVQINDVEAGRRIVERLAWRRVGRMTPQAEDAASQRAQVEASSKLDQQATAALAGVNDMFREKIRAPLIRRDAFPSQWQFWTDRDHLRISLAQHNDMQLAPASPAPEFPASYDLALGAHESMIANLSEALLGGITIKDRTWLELVKLLQGDEPRALWVHDRAEPWSVTLAAELPLLAHFDADRAAFTLRLAKVTHGSHHFGQPVEIQARFLTRSTPQGPVLVRDGDVVVRFPQSDAMQRQEQLRAFLAKKFGAVFPPELCFHGITPPDGGTLGKLNSLALVEFKSAAGWLTVGYQLKSGR